MVQDTQQNGRLGGRQAALCAALPVAIDLIFGARQTPAVLAGGLVKADSYMGLVRLRETIQSHHPTSIILRDSSGQGTLLHWSHLLDSLVCALATPFEMFLPLPAALHAAAALAGPIFMAGLGVAIAWAVAPFAERRLLWFGPLLAGLSPAIVAYGFFGDLDHHVPVVLAAVMAGGWAARIITGKAPPHAGWTLATWAATGIWLTPESMPLLLLSFGALWLAWVGNPARTDIAAAIRATGAGFLLVLLAAFVVDPPPEGLLSVEIDRLSILFVGLALAIACVSAGTVLIDRATQTLRLRLATRIAAAALLGLCCAAVWIAIFPTVLHGTDNMISNADWRRMCGIIAEMQPLTTTSGLVGCLLTGALVAMLLMWLAIRHRSLPLGYFAVCTCGLLVFGQQHMRFAAYPEAVASVMLPVAIGLAGRYFAAAGDALAAVTRVAVIASFILVPYGSGLPAAVGEAQASEAAGGPSCSVSGLAPMLAPYAGQVLLADVNDTPELLYRTHVLTVGSLYHRGMAGFLRLRAAWRSGPSEIVPPAVSATGASLVLFCPSSERPLLVGDLPRDTLLDRLNQGEVPPWLRLVATDPASGNLLYRVVP
ncbi:MAG TPA: hypothetical protein VGG99_25225 [Acetobacteraceae bacterium]|jgi:hypothetical protein